MSLPPTTDYTLRFETGGGSAIASVRGTYNTYIDLIKYIPTWRGHTFIGWYSDRGLTNRISGVYLTEDTTVYAAWRADGPPDPTDPADAAGSSTTSTPSAPSSPAGRTDAKRLESQRTGDSSPLGRWSLSLCASLAGCLTLAAWQIRRRRREADQK